MKSESVPEVDTRSTGVIGSGDCNVVIERLGFVSQHVRPRGREALVERHIIRRHPHPRSDFARRGHRLIGIARVFVKARRRRRTPGEFASLVEIERAHRAVLRRPGVETAPLVASRLEHDRLGNAAIRGGSQSVALALQILHEERELDVLLEILGCVGLEVQIAQRIAGIARPAAVPPWAHHQRIRGGRAILLRGD